MKKNNFYNVLVVLFSLSTCAQIKNVNKQYENIAYVDAIKTFERLVDKNISNPEMLQKLGNSYYFNANLLKAGSVYKMLFDSKIKLDAEYYYRYAQCLKAAQNYKLADQFLEQFNQKNNTDRRALLAAAQKDYLNVIKNNSGRYTIDDAGINSEFSDYGSSFFKNKIVFASARKKPDVNENYASWTGEKFTDLYAAETDLDGNLSKVALFSSVLNSKYHESSPVFTKDGNTVYFTRNNYFGGKRNYGSENITLLKIYKATYDGKKWSNEISLPFNSDDYQVAHPALSSDEKTLYFSSDMPGTIGRSDLFKVALLDNATFGVPENLGNKINTEGRETFPFISENNDLYFASDGHPGLGGLDVFVTKINEHTFASITNIGMPVNSSFDDFSFVINSINNSGYVSSNRPEGKGNDDIYKIKLVDNRPMESVCQEVISGLITDFSTGQALAGAKVVLLDASLIQVLERTADSNGKFDFGTLLCGIKYYIRTSMDEYSTIETPFLVSKSTEAIDLPIVLSKKSKPLDFGDDLAKLLDIPLIYFDLDKSFIRDEAAIELFKILDVLQQNPSVNIDVRSHTDSRNTAQYNINLSERRAQATVAWLISKGIDKSRLTGRGFGESRLTNGCADGIKCSEAEHQLNRRSEFIVVKK